MISSRITPLAQFGARRVQAHRRDIVFTTWAWPTPPRRITALTTRAWAQTSAPWKRTSSAASADIELTVTAARRRRNRRRLIDASARSQKDSAAPSAARMALRCARPAEKRW